MRVSRYETAGELLALHIRSGPRDEGFHLATGNDEPLQVGRNRRPAGYRARGHYHPPATRAFDDRPRQEVLHVLSGRVRAALFTTHGEAGPVVEVGPGETLVFLAGHAVDFLEDSELLEIKQGPYPGPEADKVWLG